MVELVFSKAVKIFFYLSRIPSSQMKLKFNSFAYVLGTVLFFGGAAVMEILMIRLWLMWSPLLDKWRDIENQFGYHKNLKRIFAIISILIIVFSTGNFLFFSNRYVLITLLNWTSFHCLHKIGKSFLERLIYRKNYRRYRPVIGVKF